MSNDHIDYAIEKLGITGSAALSSMQDDPKWPGATFWNCRLTSAEGRDISVIRYGMGPAHGMQAPTARQVLESLYDDAISDFVPERQRGTEKLKEFLGDDVFEAMTSGDYDADTSAPRP